jgi:hypothetical protein
MLGKLDIHILKTETRSYLSPCTKINPKLIKHLNVRFETLKLLQENIEKHLKIQAQATTFQIELQLLRI